MRERGFTLVEAIAVLVVAGVIAVTAVPMFDKRGVEQRAAVDQVIAMLGFGQKAAVAVRRGVRFTLAGNTIAAEVCSAPAQSGALCPGGAAWGALSASTLTTYSLPGSFTLGGPFPLHFDALGRPVDASGAPLGGQSVQLIGITAITVTVEPESGYVHQ